MTPELSLFDVDRAPVRRNDPETSRQAAGKVTRPSDSQALVLAAFRKYGPMTDTTLEGYTPTLTASRRRTARSELVAPNMVRMAQMVEEMTAVSPGQPPEDYWAAARHRLRVVGLGPHGGACNWPACYRVGMRLK